MHENHPQRGFTLIELLIVIVVIAILATFIVLNLLSSRIAANESAAIMSLKAIATAQAQITSSRSIDVNSDGAGEYGFLAELAGASALRAPAGIGETDRLVPPVLSQTYGHVAGGCVLDSGYLFRMYLPDAFGAFVPEADSGGNHERPEPPGHGRSGQPHPNPRGRGTPGRGVGRSNAGSAIDPEQASNLWCCYAWPAQFGTTGRRAFVVNQRGEVLACTNSTTRYGGLLSPPMAGTAAFLNANSTMSAQLAANTLAADGERWRVVN